MSLSCSLMQKRIVRSTRRKGLLIAAVASVAVMGGVLGRSGGDPHVDLQHSRYLGLECFQQLEWCNTSHLCR